MIEKVVVIKNKQGLHARPAALFVQIANKFNSDITISKGKHKVNGKSIMGIMMLEAGLGSKVTMVANGDDAEAAIKELEILLVCENIDELVI
ncbi:MAG: HPr family phosphocarrier protein [Candidatus Omnitrophica bacterium]|nr:HPr family phosphocarrier protein [Candidatus Omnitrophota bacterium]MBU0881321.1 HPr family phosphocarrier protein [Candidatus Omnitrophota bacterium]MBU1038364.1 HPr family phosphocarrier protein [Candidatus Omnitrophota bacterium]MBU1808681.1 HPr family phosphocarrier protein [Candidatus Omnitrophota bacterium]